jgi:hypothetical protein
MGAMRWIPIVVVTLAACPTPYQENTLLSSGGYEDKQLDDGSRAITVTVNTLTSRATAVDYLGRRADELCPAGYDTLDRSSSEGEEVRFRHRHPGAVTVPDGTSIESAIIRCTEAPTVPPPPGHPAARHTHAVFYCFTGDCSQDRDTCERRRAEANVDGTCQDTTAVYCTSFTAVAGGSHLRACMPDRGRCKQRHDALANQSEFTDVGECYAMLDDRTADHAVATHGFYCSASPTDPTAGVCDRDEAACTAARAKVGRDLAPCALVDSAYCFADGDQPVCAPTTPACAAKRDRRFDRNAGTGVPVGACSEVH